MDTVGLIKRMALWAGALKGSEVRLAVVLAGLQMDSEDGVVRINWTDLISATGLNWSSIDTGIRELKRLGLIEFAHRGKPGTIATYRLNLDWVPVRERELMAA